MSDDTIHLQRFYIDLARGHRGYLAHAGEPVHLRHNPMRSSGIGRRQGRLISNNNLIEHVWQGRAVTDGSLGKCIEEVRQALGAEARQYLRNVRGRGYVFESEWMRKARTSPVRTEQIDVVTVIFEELGLFTDYWPA